MRGLRAEVLTLGFDQEDPRFVQLLKPLPLVFMKCEPAKGAPHPVPIEHKIHQADMINNHISAASVDCEAMKRRAKWQPIFGGGCKEGTQNAF
jgi:hypothetical protein